MHTCTVDVQYVYVCPCECGAQLNVCRDCVTGPQCIDSTKVTRTMFFVLASLLPLSPTHHFRSTFHRQLYLSLLSESLQPLHASKCCSKKIWQRWRVGELSDSWPTESYRHFCNVLKLKFWDLQQQQLTAAEIGQVCLSVNTGRTLSARKYCSVHSSHIYCTSSLKLTVQLISMNCSAYKRHECSFCIRICITRHLFKI